MVHNTDYWCIKINSYHRNVFNPELSLIRFQDLDVVRFLIASLGTYFPSIAECVLLFEMPFLLSGKFDESEIGELFAY